MAKKKMTDARRVQKIKDTLLATSADIGSSKKTAEVLTLVTRDIALCIAIAKTEHDDDLEIARLWLEIEHSLQNDRAAQNGLSQAMLQYHPDSATSPEKKGKKG